MEIFVQPFVTAVYMTSIESSKNRGWFLSWDALALPMLLPSPPPAQPPPPPAARGEAWGLRHCVARLRQRRTMRVSQGATDINQAQSPTLIFESSSILSVRTDIRRRPNLTSVHFRVIQALTRNGCAYCRRS